MHLENDTKLITCILPKGKALLLQQALSEEKNIYSGNFHYGRGVGRDAHIKDIGIGEQEEREILEVAVSADEADSIFEFMFFAAEMDKPHGGMIYVTPITRSNIMTLPEITERA